MEFLKPSALAGLVILGVLSLITRTATAQSEEFESESSSRRSRPGAQVKRRPLSLDGVSVNPELLVGVQDNTIGLTPEDREAYFLSLKLTEKLDIDDQKLFAREFREDRRALSARYRNRPLEQFPTFVDMFQHPDEYRGHPVTLHGKFRRLMAFDAGKNEHGYDQLYEGWFFADGGQGNPAVVIFYELPEGFPLGGDIEEEISITGYFFKMYGYHAQDTTRKAPLILARSVRWFPQKTPVQWNPSPQAYVAFSFVIVVIVLVIGLAMNESARNSRALREARYSAWEQIPPLDDRSISNTRPPHENGSPVEPHH